MPMTLSCTPAIMLLRLVMSCLLLLTNFVSGVALGSCVSPFRNVLQVVFIATDPVFILRSKFIRLITLLSPVNSVRDLGVIVYTHMHARTHTYIHTYIYTGWPN